MNWFPDVFWLIGEWVILLAISVLIGVAIGWFAWRRNKPGPDAGALLAERAQARDAATTVTMSSQSDSSQSSDNGGVEGSEIDEMAVLRAERDSLVEQRDRLRDQLTSIESLVGDAESSRDI